MDRWANDKFLGVEFKPGDDRHLTAYVLGGTQHYIDKKEKKWKAVYCESAKVETEVPNTFRKWVNQQIRWKKSWVRVFLFMAPFYLKDRPLIPAITYYLQMSLSLISPIISLQSYGCPAFTWSVGIWIIVLFRTVIYWINVWVCIQGKKPRYQKQVALSTIIYTIEHWHELDVILCPCNYEKEFLAYEIENEPNCNLCNNSRTSVYSNCMESVVTLAKFSK